MGFKENEDNIYTKEKDKIEAYLFRVIQRYFDIENVHSKEYVEAIIVESIARLKQLLSWERDYIFSLNDKTGHVRLTIQDVGGEPAFEKNTAFNKDFGTVADTICEGNDPRLFNDRKPLEHVHTIESINGLQEKLDEILLPVSDLHYHENGNVLDILTYAGTKTKIDLIVVEDLQRAVEEYYTNLLLNQKELFNFQQKGLEDLAFLLYRLQGILEDASVLIADAGNWLQNAYEYTDKNIDKYKINMIHKLLDYVTKAQVQKLEEHFKKARYVIADGEFSIPDGDVSLIPVEEELSIEAESNAGDSLKTIFDEGLRLGHNDWQWDDTAQSFVYQSNETASYPMFASINKFKNYTHRVTLSSVGTDNDCISVVIAYDEDTGNHLSLVVAHGGVLATGQSGAHANVMLNFTGSGHKMVGDLLIDAAKLSTSNANWKTISGITALIKRNENNIKIWMLYNAPHSWLPEEIDNIKDIYPSEAPTFDFNLTDYPELSMFVDKECNYGYGCFSQPYSTYSDVYFAGISVFSEPYGHTNVNETKTVQHSIPGVNFNTIANSEANLFFRYDEDGRTITLPLPFSFKDENENTVIIQGAVDESGNIEVISNFMNQFPLYVNDSNLYDSETIIVATFAKRNSFDNVEPLLNSYGCSLCLIDSSHKNDFVKSLLLDNRGYFIQGKNYELEGPGFIDNDFNPLTYFDWDTDQPICEDIMNVIYINKNKKWAVVKDKFLEKHGFIAEFKIKRLSQYFENPRIYYQVTGTKEAV